MTNLDLSYGIAAAALSFVCLTSLVFTIIWAKARKANQETKPLHADDLNDLQRPLLNGVHDSDERDDHTPDNEDTHGTVKLKDNVVHWLKMILYVMQVLVNAGTSLYYLLDDPSAYKSRWITEGMIMFSWMVVCYIETVHHMLPYRRNSIFQLMCVIACVGASIVLLINENGINGIQVNQLGVWDAVYQLVIIGVEIYSCIVRVPIRDFKHMNVEYAAGIWSYFHFNWFSPMIDIGYKRPLKPDDLPELIDNDRTAQVYSYFSKLLYKRGPQNVVEGENLGVGRSIYRLGKGRLYLQALWSAISVAVSVFPVLAMHSITDYMVNYGKPGNQKVSVIILYCIGGLFVSQTIQAYADGMLFKYGRRIGMRAKSGLVSAVFRKALALDMGSVDVGKLQNHISVDAESVLNNCVMEMFMWGAVFRLFICIGLLVYYLGVSAFGGIGLLIITIPISNLIIGRLKSYQQQLMKCRDARMGIVNEAMQGIRIIKLFAWEEKFLEKLSTARGDEIKVLRGYMFMLGCFMVTIKSSPTLVGLITFLVHTLVFGKKLSAATGFVSLTLFDQLRLPLTFLPSSINDFIQARICCKRINALLSSTHSDVKTLINEYTYRQAASFLPMGQIKVENGSFRWRSSNPNDPPVLKNIDLEVQPGELVCIYGPTGSGKSSFLTALLQELIKVEGSASMSGTVSYASQRAWIQNATVRDNILFGNPMDPYKYERVIEACALKSDLAILEAGDMTEIGEKGINLSGGQQQRVSLARAVYNDSDIVLLDDVLSAVDAHVGRHIFDQCITGVLKGKTVVLVTHQISLTARKADRIVVFNADGTLRESGTYKDLTGGQEGHFEKLLQSAEGGKRQMSSASASSTVELQAKGKDGEDKGNDQEKNKRGLIISKEAHAQGNPKLSLYLRYFRYCGGNLFGIGWIGLSLLWQALTIAQSFYLKSWINEMANDVIDGPGLWQYILVSIASFGALLLRTIVITGGSVQASKRIHDSMSKSVFGAPVTWFDATPLGRIFNRFSSDIVTLDKDLMNDIASYGDVVLSVIGVVAVIVVAIPILTIAMVPILAICYWYGNRYLQSSRQLKRLEAVNRSPLYAHFSESISGASTIRAYQSEPRFIRTNEGHVDKLNRCFFHLWISNYWLTCRIRIIGSVICGIVGVFLVADAKNIDGSTAGLVLTYVLQFTFAVVFTVRLHAQMEMSVNSIERLNEYCNLEQEAPAIIEDKRPPQGWPSEGKIDVKNLYLKYASSTEPVLHGLTFSVPPRTSVGIVGRTGAGKSSLTNALFRMVEPLPGSVIEIDGVNIMDIGLRDLRKAIAIIPQEPTLFKGTIRANIDPFDEYLDMEVWDALRQCHLADYVSSTDGKLMHEVAASGTNLSVGQRQLMCMARALLRHAAVLVLDEATANVDTETDGAIQDTMRESFHDSTILCIAHRLHTVVYYDKILVLDAGRVAEYDSPKALLRDENSRFYSMCKNTGDLRNLIRMAEEGVQ